MTLTNLQCPSLITNVFEFNFRTRTRHLRTVAQFTLDLLATIKLLNFVLLLYVQSNVLQSALYSTMDTMLHDTRAAN